MAGITGIIFPAIGKLDASPFPCSPGFKDYTGRINIGCIFSLEPTFVSIISFFLVLSMVVVFMLLIRKYLHLSAKPYEQIKLNSKKTGIILTTITLLLFIHAVLVLISRDTDINKMFISVLLLLLLALIVLIFFFKNESIVIVICCLFLFSYFPALFPFELFIKASDLHDYPLAYDFISWLFSFFKNTGIIAKISLSFLVIVLSLIISGDRKILKPEKIYMIMCYSLFLPLIPEFVNRNFELDPLILAVVFTSVCLFLLMSIIFLVLQEHKSEKSMNTVLTGFWGILNYTLILTAIDLSVRVHFLL